MATIVTILRSDVNEKYNNNVDPRGENGKPLTEKPNMAVKAPFQGKTKSSYFSVMGFTTIGDKYVDPSRVKGLDALEEKKKIKNDAIFKPSSGYKEM